MTVSNEFPDLVSLAPTVSQCLLHPQLSHLASPGDHYDVRTALFSSDFHVAGPIFVGVFQLTKLINESLRGDHVLLLGECLTARQNTVRVCSVEFESISASHDLPKNDPNRQWTTIP